MAKRITSTPAGVVEKSELAGVVGQMHVKLLSGDAERILLPPWLLLSG